MVMTAAHKLEGVRRSEVTVRCGDWDTRSHQELFPHQDRGAARMIVHEGYDNKGQTHLTPFFCVLTFLICSAGSGNLKNDIALVEVDSPFVLAPHVDTVCLPSPGQDFTDSRCAATGWGSTRFGESLKK